MNIRLFYLLPLFFCGSAPAQDVLLAKEYRGQNIRGWLMSEKLDGVRAYWDGRRLLSRNGYPFTPPEGFTRNFPPYPLDGELYSGRGQFERISAAVRSSDGDWTGIRLHVFDVPAASGTLPQRLAVISGRLKQYPANIVVIPQHPVSDAAHAQAEMAAIVAAGGEGLIVRDPALPYRSGRSDGFLKLKPQQDAECTVTRHHEGRGKYAGKLGAVSCRNAAGEFKIGSGFSDADRTNPPPVGSTITYRHRGYTAKGLPRFATYLRPRTAP